MSTPNRSEISPEHTSSSSGNTASLKKSLSIAALIMMSSVFLSRVTGLFREMVIAGYGGTSYEIDAYVTAFFIPELLNHFLAGGFLTVTFIPIFQKYAVRNDYDGGWRVMSNLLTIGSILFAILIPLTIIFTPQLMSLLGTKSTQLPLTIHLTRIILPAQMFFYWGAFLSSVQMVHNRFLFPALAPLIYNLGIIAGGLILGPRMGVEGFAWGVVGGAFLGNFALQVPGAMRAGMRYRPVLAIRDPDLIKYVKTTLPLILGLGMSFSNETFFRFFGSFLDEGGTSSVNYALRTMMIVVGVFGQASGVAFYPFLSKYAVQNEFEKMSRLLNTVLTKIAVYLIPLSAIMAVLAPQIITVLYQRGKFTAESTAYTAPVFAIYLAGAFTFSGSMIINRAFYALQRTILPMVISTIVALATIPMYLVFCSWIGARGIALAAILGMLAEFIILYVLWYRNNASSDAIRESLVSLAKIIVISGIGALVCWGLKSFWMPHTHSFSPAIAAMLVGGFAGGSSLAVVFLLYEAAGVQKLRDSVRGLLRRK